MRFDFLSKWRSLILIFLYTTANSTRWKTTRTKYYTTKCLGGAGKNKIPFGRNRGTSTGNQKSIYKPEFPNGTTMTLTTQKLNFGTFVEKNCISWIRFLQRVIFPVIWIIGIYKYECYSNLLILQPVKIRTENNTNKISRSLEKQLVSQLLHNYFTIQLNSNFIIYFNLTTTVYFHLLFRIIS